jgi:hypothetical protein
MNETITVENGRDGKWTAYATGAMGRKVCASAESGDRARKWVIRMLVDQQAEAYFHEQSMTHLSLVRDGEI